MLVRVWRRENSLRLERTWLLWRRTMRRLDSTPPTIFFLIIMKNFDNMWAIYA